MVNVTGRPSASTPETRRRMQQQRRKDTLPERTLRSILHRRGFRFRVDYQLPGLRRRADIVFPGKRVAVMVDGCFWHGCPQHATWPKQNAHWWRAKIEGNIVRDRDTDKRLARAGWLAIRVWEHEDPAEAAERIATALRNRED
jgi:DNA mismatch endonuclease, patch repair protein